MRTAVCVPWRGGDRYRERAWGLVHEYYKGLGLPIYTADTEGDPFSAGRARNAAARQAEPWDVVVFIDADCVMPLPNVVRGIEHAVSTRRITLPWDSFYSMTKIGHDLGFDQQVPFRLSDHSLVRHWEESSIPCAKPVYSPGGNMVVPRKVWDKVGGFDERFSGWGFEDAAILISAGKFDRLSGPLYHFWHPARFFDTPTPAFYHAEYMKKPVDQFLVDESRHMNRFGTWG